MVCVQQVQAQEASRQRKLRQELARKQGSALGVLSARHYQEQKRQQAAAVRTDMRQAWEQDHRKKQLEVSVRVEKCVAERGSATRAAVAAHDALRQRAALEANAWAAERKLAAMRASVGKEALSAKAADEKAAENARAQLRDRVRGIERERARHVCSRSQSQSTIRSQLSVSTVSAAHNRSASSHRVVLAQRPDGSASQSLNTTHNASAKAEEHSAVRAREITEFVKTAQKQHIVAHQRSARAAAAIRHKKETEHHDALQEQALKAQAQENARQRHVLHVDYQEREARRSQALNQELHRKFEETFLSGPWDVEDVHRTHCPPSDSSRDDTSLLFPSSDTEETPMVFDVAHRPLITKPLDVVARPVVEGSRVQRKPLPTPSPCDAAEGEGQEEAVDEAVVVAGDGDMNWEEEVPEPHCHMDVPAPQTQTPSPPQDEQQEEPQNESVSHGSDVSGGTGALGQAGASEVDTASIGNVQPEAPQSTEGNADEWRHANDRLLHDLASLQSRIQRVSSAGGDTAPVAQATTTVANTEQAEENSKPSAGTAPAMKLTHPPPSMTQITESIRRIQARLASVATSGPTRAAALLNTSGASTATTATVEQSGSRSGTTGTTLQSLLKFSSPASVSVSSMSGGEHDHSRLSNEDGDGPSAPAPLRAHSGGDGGLFDPHLPIDGFSVTSSDATRDRDRDLDSSSVTSSSVTRGMTAEEFRQSLLSRKAGRKDRSKK